MDNRVVWEGKSHSIRIKEHRTSCFEVIVVQKSKITSGIEYTSSCFWDTQEEAEEYIRTKRSLIQKAEERQSV